MSNRRKLPRERLVRPLCPCCSTPMELVDQVPAEGARPAGEVRSAGGRPGGQR